MDRTLLGLVVLSLMLVVLFAPYATMTLGTIVLLSAIATRGVWAVLQSLSPVPQPQPQRVMD